MPSVWLPNGAADSILAEKAGTDEAHRVKHVIEGLKALDHRMGMFLCDRADPENELRMGFWYVFRRNDNGTVAMFEVSAPDGSFVEPTWHVVEAFQKMDRDSLHDLRDRQEAKRRKEAREEARKREERAARLQELADFTFRTAMPFSVDTSHWKR